MHLRLRHATLDHVGGSRDLALVLALRLPLDALCSIELICDRRAPARAEVDELRPIYADLLAGGWRRSRYLRDHPELEHPAPDEDL